MNPWNSGNCSVLLVFPEFPRHCRLLGNGELKQVAEIMGKLVETLGLELQVSQSNSAAEIYIVYIWLHRMSSQ